MKAICKVDRNQAEIVAALRKAGASVLSLARLSKGCPDILIAHLGRMWLVEVKNGDKGKLRQSQIDFAAAWKSPIHVVRSVDDALKLLAWTPERS